MQVVLAESALEDLQAILDWYQQEKVPDVGQRLVDDILNQAGQIEGHPMSGRMVPEFQNPKLRELIRPPFRIVYLLEDDVCSIVRVWRSERLLRLP
ncbi:MAG: type II toxin-antitoxin system RelE/ParE family toxin [Gammaproteobacteria bacterium]|nr:type II toxin-antitoxin system RelE/ParE family toxin [Gammaproteobacteria bacterium]MBU1724208.1 type II toxin-antitoxin system RelE/ParE family toxin [Gammaproteobacteria bacterium]MBU2005656.1 type II toxin-antitoxin system RelE/ParE family toxin [Gammaproteobacteria bacterium]